LTGDKLVIMKPHSLLLFTSFALGVGLFGVQGTVFNMSENNSGAQDVVGHVGAFRVGIQAGHLKSDEAPEELSGLHGHGTGARGGGATEQEVVLKIARLAAEMLREKGVIVDVLPTTIPPLYRADAFVSIHADSNPSVVVSGFKLSAPLRGIEEKSPELEDAIYDSYEKATGLRRDPNITDSMKNYYAFNWRKYQNAVDPFTPAVIIETGFITSPFDQRVIVSNPELSARGIADGVFEFLNKDKN